MREVLGSVDPAALDTPLGKINVRPLSAGTVQVEAPHITVNGVPLNASAFLNGSPKTRRFDLVKETRDGLWFTAPNALRATLVDGRTADVVVLAKIAEVVIPAVNKLAQERSALFLEAERRDLNNSILGFEQQIDALRGRVETKELELKAVEQELHKLLG